MKKPEMIVCSHNSIPGYFDGAEDGCCICTRNKIIADCMEYHDAELVHHERDIDNNYIHKSKHKAVLEGLKEKKHCDHDINKNIESCSACYGYHWDNDGFNKKIDQALKESKE